MKLTPRRASLALILVAALACGWSCAGQVFAQPAPVQVVPKP